MDFWRVVEILERRKWLILFSVVVTAALTFGATRLTGTRWASTVRIAAVQSSSDLANNVNKPANDDDPLRQEKITEAELPIYLGLLKSKEVLKPSLQSIGESELSQDRLKFISLEAAGTNSYELSVTDNNSNLSETLANALADNLVKASSVLYSKQSGEVVQLLRGQLSKADQALEIAHQKYDAYRRQHQILGDQTEDINISLSQLNQARQKRDEISQSLAESQARLDQSKTQLALLPKRIPVPDTTINPMASALEQKLAQSESELTVLRARYTDEKIEVRQAIAARDALSARLAQVKSKGPELQLNPAIAQSKQTISQLQQEATGYQAQLALAEANVRKSSSEVRRSMGSDSQLGMLAADLAQKTEARSNIASRLQSARIDYDSIRGRAPLTIVSWVSDFNPPINTRSGRTKKLLLISMLCALFASSGLIISFENIDRRVKTVKEADLALPVPVCAAIPQPTRMISSKMLPRVTEYDPLSIHAESYHFLALRLLRASLDTVQSVMFVSTKLGQGSTSALANLGIALAQAGKRVVLVDANIRAPELHHIFNLPNDFGFTSLLGQPPTSSLEMAMNRTSVPNLSVITSGPTSENPWMMFRSQSLIEISDRLREMADYVLYDTPSAATFTDAYNLTSVIDAALLCVRALEPLSGTERQLIEQLQSEHVLILGSVLTDVPVLLLENYNNYRQYYPNQLSPHISSGVSDTTSDNRIDTIINEPILPSSIESISKSEDLESFMENGSADRRRS